jgi:hypothetical protein
VVSGQWSERGGNAADVRGGYLLELSIEGGCGINGPESGSPSMDFVYKALLLVPADISCGLDGIARELRNFYGKGASENAPRFEEAGSTLKLVFPKLQFVIHYSALPHVLVESGEIAELFAAAHRDRAKIAGCASRFEVHSEGQDESMEFFNDFLFVVEAGQRLGRLRLILVVGLLCKRRNSATPCGTI